MAHAFSPEFRKLNEEDGREFKTSKTQKPRNYIVKSWGYWVGEMAQQLKELVFPGLRFGSQHPRCSLQPPVTPLPEDRTPSSDFLGTVHM